MPSVSTLRCLAGPALPPQLASRTRPSERLSRRQPPPVANLGGLLQQLQGRSRADRASSGKVAAARQRLVQQLSSPRPDTAAISEACDELMAACVPFREADLGGGPWQVRPSRPGRPERRGATVMEARHGCCTLHETGPALNGWAFDACLLRRLYTRGARCYGSCGRAAPAVPREGVWQGQTATRCASCRAGRETISRFPSQAGSASAARRCCA